MHASRSCDLYALARLVLPERTVNDLLAPCADQLYEAEFRDLLRALEPLAERQTVYDLRIGELRVVRRCAARDMGDGPEVRCEAGAVRRIELPVHREQVFERRVRGCRRRGAWHVVAWGCTPREDKDMKSL